MKILIVCSGNAPDFDFRIHQAFIYDQIEMISKNSSSITYDTFFIKGKGIKGYSNNLSLLKTKINQNNPNLIHAHGGHAGLLCVLQRKVKVIVTFHGSDVNYFKNRCISIMASLLSAGSIFVSNGLYNKIRLHGPNASVIPCGVDIDVFLPLEKKEAKKLCGYPENEPYILFSSSFDNVVKNFPLAEIALSNLPKIRVREIKGKTRGEVNLILNGAELLLLTSLSEGSPQIIKEAMACNTPVVSTDVGDIREVIGNTEGTYICSFDPKDVAEKIRCALQFATIKEKTSGRERIITLGLSNEVIAGKVYDVYLKLKSKG